MKYEKIKELRILNRYSQKQIAELLDMQVTQYRRYENGERSIPIEVIIKLADIYDVSIDYLVGREEPEQQNCKDVG